MNKNRLHSAYMHSKCNNKSEDKTIKSMKVIANRTTARIVAGSNSEKTNTQMMVVFITYKKKIQRPSCQKNISDEFFTNERKCNVKCKRGTALTIND